MIQIPLPFVINADKDPELLRLLFEAHAKTALENENASTFACMNAGIVTGRLENGIASAILTLGGHHAPISKTRTVLDYWVLADVEHAISMDKFIPGFGNAFYKDSIDPAWSGVDNRLRECYPEMHGRIMQLQEWVNKTTGKTLYPNAAIYTAAVCDIIGVLEGTEVALLMLARIPVWTKAFSDWNDNHRLI